MVDETMLKGIKSCLNTIDTLLKSEILGEMLAQYGIDVSLLAEEQVVDAIADKLLSEDEKSYYAQYKRYKKQKDLEMVAKSLTSLEVLTSDVSALYEERRVAIAKINHIGDIVKRIEIKFHDLPLIRISTLHTHLEYDYNKYSSRVIKAGMDESKLNDRIHSLSSASYLIRSMKSKDLAIAKRELKSMKSKAEEEISERREKYNRTKEEYIELLKSVILELLRDELFLNAVMLSVRALYNKEFEVEQDYAGVDRVTSQSMNEVSKAALIDDFFAYFESKNDDKIDAQTFSTILKEFILYYYTVTIRGLEGQKDRCLRDINRAFATQRSIISGLQPIKYSLSMENQFSTDEEDTLSLVYPNPNK